MVAGSILPVTIYKNQLCFLFGKENSMEDSAKGWSDFGGGVDKGESPFQTALREGGEELTGFLGDHKQIQKLIRKGGGVYKITHNDYHVHIFYIDYDKNLPLYYNQNHKFLWERMDKKVLNDSKLFEKIEIDWFTLHQLKTRKQEFRKFYQEIVDSFLDQSSQIRKFIDKKKNRKTMKNYL
jgi:8-oxo-dGTP pyrophosphatase MutT (NUDIX family)